MWASKVFPSEEARSNCSNCLASAWRWLLAVLLGERYSSCSQATALAEEILVANLGLLKRLGLLAESFELGVADGDGLFPIEQGLVLVELALSLAEGGRPTLLLPFHFLARLGDLLF